MPNISQFKSKKDYLKWYKKYRNKNRKKLRTYNREYACKRRRSKKTIYV